MITSFGVARIRSGDYRQTMWLALAVITAFALFLRLSAMTGLIGDDDLKYARYAKAIMHGGYAQAVAEARGHEYLHWAVRYGLLLPLAAVYSLFGVSEWTTILLPLVGSTAAVPLLALIGQRLFGWRVALIAGLLYATFPLQLRYATTLVPEPIAECFVLIAVLCYLHASRNRAAWYVAAGVLFGVAYLTKESAIFIGGAFILHDLWKREWRGALLLGAGLAAVLAVEHGYYIVVHGDVLFRPHATVFYDPSQSHGNGSVDLNLNYRLFKYYPRRMLVPSVFFGLHSLACLVGAALALTSKRRSEYALLLMMWAVVPWLYLNFGTSSFERYVVVPAQNRYIEFTYPPLMLLTGVFVSRMLRIPGTRAVAAASIVGVVCVWGAVTGVAMRGRAGNVAAEMTMLREIVNRAHAVPGGKILVDDDQGWKEALEILDPSIVSPSRDAASFVIKRDPLGLPSLRWTERAEAAAHARAD